MIILGSILAVLTLFVIVTWGNASEKAKNRAIEEAVEATRTAVEKNVRAEVTGYLQVFSEVTAAAGDEYTAGALDAAAKAVWHGLTHIQNAEVFRNESRRREKRDPNNFCPTGTD